jgi:enterochelin esterase-like enzyme
MSPGNFSTVDPFVQNEPANTNWLPARADKSKVPPITIETGTEDGTVSLSSVQAFVNKLKDKEIPCEFITRSGGHTWQFWQECLPKALKKVGESFK